MRYLVSFEIETPPGTGSEDLKDMIREIFTQSVYIVGSELEPKLMTVEILQGFRHLGNEQTPDL